MGRTSKFSFPIPGRKHTSSKESTPIKPVKPLQGQQNLSKAQRILGTGDLNIDSPTKDEEPSWRYSSSRSSRMSISISESTQSSANESVSVKDSPYGHGQWDRESGVLPRSQRLHGKASSTLLGQPYGDDGATTTTTSRRLRNEDSSSTLRSHYDRQKSPLSISQQTSASSARDLALRKGFPPVVQRSPLLNVESSLDPYNDQFSQGNHRNERHQRKESTDYNQGMTRRDSESRKKPAKLDLSMLFPRSRKHGDKSSDAQPMMMSPSSISTNTSQAQSSPGRRKLAKSRSKESLQSTKHSIRSTQSHDPRHRQPPNSRGLYDHYEQTAVRTPRMERIPESRVPSRVTSRQIPADEPNNFRSPVSSRPPLEREKPSSSGEKSSFSWKNVRSSMISPKGEVSSSASISSRNTKASRRTTGSGISNSDLKQKSVLSLSSDSEGEDFSDPGAAISPVTSSNDKASRVLNGSAPVRQEARRPVSQFESGGLSPRSQNTRQAPPPSRNNFLGVPGTSRSTLVSPPYSEHKVDPPKTSSQRRSSQPPRQKDRLSPATHDRRASKRESSVVSARSARSSHSQQPTPPLSPASVEFREVTEESSRFMAVTKQEEALLEALRLKRARMREKIIEEHEIAKSPPRNPQRSTSRISETSSTNTVHGQQRILLYLDTPLAESQEIDMAEPSPDLSDFLSFGSDEDSTPRTSWAPPPRARPDSAVSPRLRNPSSQPMTPPSAARLSAVGVGAGFRTERSAEHAHGGVGAGIKKRGNGNGNGVRFVDDAKLVNPQDYLMDGREAEEIWGL
ncbi:hypothetical protein B0J14DRAFT_271999 [Halenospora varia]|nr:hypothetical protein B0J14DRAFT_271999 [Halenospora varia]